MITLGPALDIRESQRRNLCSNPGINFPGNSTYGVGWWTGSAPNAVTTAQSSAPWSKSGKAFRVTWTTRTSTTGDIGLNPSNMPDMFPRLVGRTISVSMVVNASADFTSATSLTPANVVGATATSMIISRNSLTPKANQPTRFWGVFQVPASVTAIGGFRVTVNMAATAGVWAEISDIEIYEGIVDFNNIAPSNGATDGWKWDGVPWGSTSVGYPYTLERIAGKAMGDAVGNNVSVPISGDPLGPFTVLSVYDVFGTQTGFTTIYTFGGAPTPSDWTVAGAFAYSRAGSFSDNTYSHSRLGTSAANNQTAVTRDGTTSIGSIRGFAPGRHVIAQSSAGGPAGSTSIRILSELDNGTISQSGQLQWGNGVARGVLKARSGQSNTEGVDMTADAIPLRTLYYPTQLSTTQIQAACRWLASKYSFAVA